MEKRQKLLLVVISLLFLVLSAAWAALPRSGAAEAATAVPTPLATQVSPTTPPLSLTLTLLFTCCALGAVVGVIVLGFLLSLERRKQGQDQKQP